MLFDSIDLLALFGVYAGIIFLISEIHGSKQCKKIGIRWLMMAADVSDGQMDVSENSGFPPQILPFQ